MASRVSQLAELIGLIVFGVGVFISKTRTLYRIWSGKRPYLVGLIPGLPFLLFACSCFVWAYAVENESRFYSGWFALGGWITSMALLMVIIRLWIEGVIGRSSE